MMKLLTTVLILNALMLMTLAAYIRQPTKNDYNALKSLPINGNLYVEMSTVIVTY